MARNRISFGAAVRRALAAGRLPAVAALAALAALSLAGCGGSSSAAATTAASERAADVETLAAVLDRELGAAEAYRRAMPRLHGADLRRARRFRAQEQEHVDAVLKAVRGLGGHYAPAPEAIATGRLRSRAAALSFLYELESDSLAYDLRAIHHLHAPWPRVLLASIGAAQAEHLVLLRQALGADPPELAPSAFEDGTMPAP